MKIGLTSELDEFNYVNFVNYIDFPNRERDEYYVDANDTTDVLFPSFDKIVIPNAEYFNRHSLTSEDPEYLMKRDTILYVKDCVLDWYKKNNIKIFDRKKIKQQYFDSHIYHFMFRTIAKQMQENKLKWVLPKKNDYFRVKSEIESLCGNKPVVVIVGRNIDKLPYKNIFLEKYIKELLKRGAFVVNTTINAPKFEFENYLEIDKEVFTYSEQASYFLNANFVITPGHAGGTSVHFTTPANFLTFPFIKEFWVKNDWPDYTHNGKNIFTSRCMIDSVKTVDAPYNDFSKLDECLAFEKPKITEFFDESKIVKININI